MSMEMQAWHSLYQAMHASDESRPFSGATLRRIAGFARPHRRRLAVFLVLSVVGAVLAVATPVLAGRVVDAIDTGGPPGVVVGLAVLIAVIAVAEEQYLTGRYAIATYWLCGEVRRILHGFARSRCSPRVARDIVFLEAVEINPVVVHGGGKVITEQLEKACLKANFVQGQRVTDEATVAGATEVPSREINPERW